MFHSEDKDNLQKLLVFLSCGGSCVVGYQILYIVILESLLHD